MNNLRDHAKGPIINIIVRTCNEERWILSLLSSLRAQTYKNFSVSIVDSGSNDKTIEWALSDNIPDVRVTKIESYRPGRALNVGASSVDSDYLVCLSAHCLPSDDNWLSKLVSYMEAEPDCIGAYGRQLPMESTPPDDLRDLFMLFPTESRRQYSDPSFHNANSIIRTTDWKNIRFDEETKHLEDRLWAQRLLKANSKKHIAYLSDAAVYHEHGPNQHGPVRSFRADGVATVLREGLFPASCVGPHNHTTHRRSFRTHVLLVVRSKVDLDRAISVRETLKSSDVHSFSLLCRAPLNRQDMNPYELAGLHLMPDIPEQLVFSEFIAHSLSMVEDVLGLRIDAIQFFDLSYAGLFQSIAQTCISRLFSGWHDAVVPAWEDFGCTLDGTDRFSNDGFIRVDSRAERAYFRIVLGRGATFRSDFARRALRNVGRHEIVTTRNPKILLRNDYDWDEKSNGYNSCEGRIKGHSV